MGTRKGYQKIQSSFGQQIWDKDLRMGLEQWFHAGLYSLVMMLIAAFIFCMFWMDLNVLWFVTRGVGAGIISSFAPSLPLPLDGHTVTSSQLYQASKEFGLGAKLSSCLKILLFSVPVGIGTFMFMFLLYRQKADEIEVLKHLDGTELKSPAAVMKRMNELNREQPERWHRPTLPIGDAFLTHCSEVFGLLIVGAMGSGKSVIFMSILRAIEKLNASAQHTLYKVVTYTTKGDFIEKLYRYDRGDIIFNAFDLRGLRLNVFSLVKNNTDFLRIASIMIPEPKGNAEPFWVTAGRDCFAAMLNYCFMTGKKNNAAVWTVLCFTREEIIDKIAPLFGSEETLKYFSDPKLASNISAVIAGYTNIFKYLPPGDDDFDIKNWLENKEQKGWIHISNHREVREPLKPWLTLFIDALVSVHMSLPDEYYDRRIVYALDEVNTLNATIAGTIVELSITGRSKGSVCMCAGQGLGGFHRTFGEEGTQDIVGAFGNSIFMRTGDNKTADWMSNTLGDTMFLEAEVSHSAKTGEGADGTTTRMVRKTEKLRLPSVFLNVLGSLEGYVRLAEYGVYYTKWKYESMPKINEGFIPRPDIDMNSIKAEWDSTQKTLSKATIELTEYERKLNQAKIDD